jgi:hypothetical protein
MTVKLCATATLPTFIKPQATRSHVGNLGTGAGIVAAGDASAQVVFDGLEIGHDGAPTDTSESVKECPASGSPGIVLKPDEAALLSEERQGGEDLDCRVSAFIDPSITIGALELRHVEVNLVKSLSDPQRTKPTFPQFRILALVNFGKYLSTDGGTPGVVNAQFNDNRMVVSGRFANVVSAHFGAISAGIRGFSMDFNEQQRSFIAEGGQVSAGNGVSTTTLYFSEVAFVEVFDKKRDAWRLAKLRAPIDVTRTGLGLLFRLVTDLGSSSFLHLFRLR